MIIYKHYIGKHENIKYYIINKGALYGIELIQESTSDLTSTYEWLSENKEETLSLGQRLCSCGASPIHLEAIIDDFMQ